MLHGHCFVHGVVAEQGTEGVVLVGEHRPRHKIDQVEDEDELPRLLALAV